MTLRELATDALPHLRTTPSVVADVLREAILRGVLQPGQPLVQDEIAAQFGLSRIPVREALRQLQGEGLVVLSPRRGAVVSELSAAEIREISEMRIVLETLAIRLAIPGLTDDALQHAEGLLDVMGRSVPALAHWSTHHWQFHETLYAPADRPRLLSTIHTLHTHVARYLVVHRSVLDRGEDGRQEHRQILDACRRRDSAHAAALIEQHIAAVARLLVPYFTDHAGAETAEASAPGSGYVGSAGATDAADGHHADRQAER